MVLRNEHIISGAVAVVGGFLSAIFGGFDTILQCMLAFILLDFITGTIKALYLRELSSEVMYSSLLKKIMELLSVVAGVVFVKFTDVDYIRDWIICFNCTMEGISVMENIGMFIELPDFITDFLYQLKDKYNNYK